MRDNSGKIILALLAGASAGVIAGLLMAPDSGETTRGNLKKFTSKLTKDLEGTLQAGMDRLEGMGLGNLMGRGGDQGGNSGRNTGGGSTAGGGSTSGAAGGNA